MTPWCRGRFWKPSNDSRIKRPLNLLNTHTHTERTSLDSSVEGTPVKNKFIKLRRLFLHKVVSPCENLTLSHSRFVKTFTLAQNKSPKIYQHFFLANRSTFCCSVKSEYFTKYKSLVRLLVFNRATENFSLYKQWTFPINTYSGFRFPSILQHVC